MGDAQGLGAGPRALSGSDLIRTLNEGQREAALALVGPVRILAGPGTGKTRTITHRIAYGIRNGVYDPDRVLAITFTNRAAGELRTRLAGLQVPTVQARTFHSAALRQLSFFWRQVIGGEPPRVVSSKSKMVAEAAERAGARLDPTRVREVAEHIEWRKVTETTLHQYAEHLATGERQTPARLTAEQTLDIMQLYEQVKDERRVIDFEDVLLATAGMLETESWVTQQVRSQYRFFVVDEYQDVAPLHAKLLGLWMGSRRDLCVVGDPAQSIYSFTGATNRYLLDFEREYPEARTIRLDESYRSTTPILAAANALGEHIPSAITLARPVRDDETPRREPIPELDDYADEVAEARGVAKRIRAALERGDRASEIAVLVRTNAQTAVLERVLTDEEIPFRLFGGQAFFSRPEVRQALAGLHGAVVAGQHRAPLFQAVSDVLRERGWSLQPPRDPGPVLDAWRSLDAIMRLADAAPEGTTLEAFTTQLALQAKHQHEPALEAVTIATIHASKGLEWDRVFVVGLSEGKLPIVQAIQSGDVAEERRLLYVALTRARRALHLSWSRVAPPGAPFDAQGQPSRFLAELGTRIRRGTHLPQTPARPS